MIFEKNKIFILLRLLQKTKEVFLVFIFLSLTTLLWLNWGTFREVFNYRAVYGDTIEDLQEIFAKDGKVAAPMPKIDLVPKAAPENDIAFETNPKSQISIPKINVTAPLLFAENSNEQYLQKLLKQGVVAYPGSVLPGKEGISIMLGHSAPSGWPKINYDWVFSDLNELKENDVVLVSFGQQTYSYVVTKKFILNKGQDIPIERVSAASSVIVLLTCWPPGVDYKRIAVQVELM